MTDVEIPFNYEARSWAEPIHSDRAANLHQFLTIVAHRKSGKTTLAVAELVKAAFKTPGTYWYVSPSFRLAKDTIWKAPEMLFKYLPPIQGIKRNEVELTVTLPSGAAIYLYGADRPQFLRGPNPAGVVIDEVGYIKEEVWGKVIEPQARARGAWVMFIGTPNGRGLLHRLYSKGLEPDSKYKSWHVPITASGLYGEEWIKEARAGMIERNFLQEYMCEFLEGAGQVFRKVRDCVRGELQEPKTDGHYVGGVDLGRKQDFTSIKLFDWKNNHLVFSDRFKEIDWPFQKKRIKEVSKKYNNALMVIEANIGDSLIQDLQREGVPVEPFMTTVSSKKDMIENLSIKIEQGQISYPDIPNMITELESYSYQITPLGATKYGAPSGLHDDDVIALGLAVSKLFPIPSKQKVEKPPTPLQVMRRTKQREFYEPDDTLTFEEVAQGF